MEELELSKTFEDRMKERVKNDIGELLTDDELTQIIKKHLDGIFLKERFDTSGFHTKRIPPLLENTVKELMEDNVKIALNEYMEEHKVDVLDMVQKTIKLGIGDALMSAMQYKFSSDLCTLESNIVQSLNRG